MSSEVSATAPAKKQSAIEIIEQEIVTFIKQREQAVANVHAVEGALQGAQHLIAKLKAEEAKAESEGKKGIALVEKV